MRTVIALFHIIGFALPLHAAEPVKRYEFREVHMGAEWTIILYAPNEATADKAKRAAFERIQQLEAIMTDYNPKSELIKLCVKNDGEPGKPIPLSADLWDVLTKAHGVAEKSDGAFDITVGPCVKLWRVARKVKEKPDAKELAAARELVGFAKMKFDAKTKTVTLDKAKMRLDLGGIGKGYAADAALEALQKLGVSQALIAASGDITAGEAPPDKDGWEVEIAPISKDQPARKLKLVKASVSTSGDLFQHVEIDGVRYSHLLDPKTGLGLTGRRSATVIAPKGWQADAYTKVASVMPPKDARKLIEAIGGEMYVVTKADDEAPEVTIETKGFASYTLSKR